MPVLNAFRLTNKVALVPGDGRGWTSALASALAEAGASVAIASLHKQEADEAVKVVQKHRTKSVAVVVDLTKASEVARMAHEVESKLGPIDILVNNAQSEFGKPFLEVSEAEWKRVMDSNVNSVFLCCQTVGKRMVERNRGRIINVTSVLAVRGLGNSVAYCASQGAVHQITQSLGIEWARTKVRVNGIGAGWVTAKEVSKEETAQDPIARYLPLRRRGQPNDLCGLLLYLASDSCDFVTAQTIFIDGGALAHA